MTAANASPANTSNTKPAAKQAAPKDITNMATAKEIDYSKFSVEELLEMSKKAQEQATAMSQKLFDDTINFLDDKLKAMGRTKAQAALALVQLMSDQERADVAAYFKSKTSASTSGSKAVKGSKAPKVYADADSTGARPEVGKTYKLPDGTQFTRKPLGKSPGNAVEAAKIKTWAEMLVK